MLAALVVVLGVAKTSAGLSAEEKRAPPCQAVEWDDASASAAGNIRITAHPVALDGVCDGRYPVNASMAILLGCSPPCDVNDPANGMYAHVIHRRVVSHALGDYVGQDRIVMLATGTQALEQNGFEEPRLSRAHCSDAQMPCLPGPCAVLDMSWYNDPMSRYDTEAHGTLLSQAKGSDKSRNFRSTKKPDPNVQTQQDHATLIFGYGQCDPQAGSRLIKYEGSISNFSETAIAIPDSNAARLAMQRLSSETRSSKVAYGSDGLPLWPDTIPVPPVFRIGEAEVNPLYMFCPDYTSVTPASNESGYILEHDSGSRYAQSCADLVAYKTNARQYTTPPAPVPWQCSDATKPPPIVWVVPTDSLASQHFEFTTQLTASEVKDELVRAGKQRYRLIEELTSAMSDADKAEYLNTHYYYTYEQPNRFSDNAKTDPYFHPHFVRCIGSERHNPHDHFSEARPSPFGTHQGYLEVTNCYEDPDHHNRMFFGSLVAPYKKIFTPVLVFPQLPEDYQSESARSVPGAFSKFAQVVGFIFAPQATNVDTDGVGHFDTVIEALSMLAGSEADGGHVSFRDYNIDKSALEYDLDTCHVFSEEQPDGGGCSWLPPHEPPGLCLDARARKQQDMVALAQATRASTYGQEFGLLDFSRYQCTNFHVTVGATIDHSNPATLQSRGPVECMQARVNLKREAVAYDLGSDSGLFTIHSHSHRKDTYDKVRERRTVGNFVFRFSHTPKEYDPHYAMLGTGVAPMAIDVTVPPGTLRLTQSTQFRFSSAKTHPATSQAGTDPPQLAKFISDHCQATYNQNGGYKLPNSAGCDPSTNTYGTDACERRYCNFTGLPTDTNSESTGVDRPAYWMNPTSGLLLGSPMHRSTGVFQAYTVCPEFRCEDSRYGVAEANWDGLPFAGIKMEGTGFTEYMESACACCTYGNLWQDYHDMKKSEREQLWGTPQKYWEDLNEAQQDAVLKASPFESLYIGARPDNWRPAGRCSRWWKGETGTIFTDIFYSIGYSAADRFEDGKFNAFYKPHFSQVHSTFGSLSKDEDVFQSIGIGSSHLKFEYATDDPRIGVRWHWNTSLLSWAVAGLYGKPVEVDDKLDDLKGPLSLYGLVAPGQPGIGSAAVEVCAPGVAGCQGIRDSKDLHPDILLGPGAENFVYSINDEKFAVRDGLDPDLYATNFVQGTTVQHRLPEKIPYDGYAFARTRAWTSNVDPGKACSCRGREPAYQCSLDTLEDARKYESGLYLKSMDALLGMVGNSTAEQRQYLGRVLSSVVVATCGFKWANDLRSDAPYGLKMDGISAPFFVYQHNQYNGDYVHSESLRALMSDKESKDPKELASFVFTNPIDPATLVDKVWKFKSTCLHYPYGHAHVQSFSASDEERILRDSTIKTGTADVNGRKTGTREFGWSTILGYCERVPSSPTGRRVDSSEHLIHCTDDTLSQADRTDFCRRNPLANYGFGGLRIERPSASTMCNDRVCLFVPGHEAAPTLRRFLELPVDFTDKTVLVAPFTATTVQYAMFFDLYVDAPAGSVAQELGQNVTLVDKSAFLHFAAIPPDATADSVMDVMAGFYAKLCPFWRPGGPRIGPCRVPALPSPTTRSADFDLQPLEQVSGPMDFTEARIQHPGVTLKSAVEGVHMWFSGAPANTVTYTRVHVGAPGATVGDLVADQTGCSSGFRCAAVVFSGLSVANSTASVIRATGTRVPVMALGRDTVAFGKAGLGELDADGLLIRVDPEYSNDFGVAVAAARGTVTVGCTQDIAQCGAIVQPLHGEQLTVVAEPDVYRPTSNLSTPLLLFDVFDMQEATGLFGDAEERVIYSRPVDHNVTAVGLTITLIVIAAVTLIVHLSLFFEATSVCVWLVRRRIGTRDISIKTASGWSIERDLATFEFVFRDNQINRAIEPAFVTIANIVAGINGGCERYQKYKGLAEYALHTLQ